MNQTSSDQDFAVYFMKDVNLLEFLFHVSFLFWLVFICKIFSPSNIHYSV